MIKILFSFVLIFSSMAHSEKLKYGPEATVLSHSHDYFRKAQAPDYWALSPYYLPQENGKSCSVASVAMVVNAARSSKTLGVDDKLATHEELLKKVGDQMWIDAVDMKKPGGGVALDDLKTLVEKSLAAYGIKGAKVEAIHMEKSSASKEKLHNLLVQNEKSAKDFIIINFLQGVYTGDSDVGHISPVAAYDAKNKKVLVMDVDREWYEPYWVSEETLAAGMATTDKQSGKNRGYLYISL